MKINEFIRENRNMSNAHPFKGYLPALQQFDQLLSAARQTHERRTIPRMAAPMSRVANANSTLCCQTTVRSQHLPTRSVVGRGVLIARHILIGRSGTCTLITSSLSACHSTDRLTGDWHAMTIWRTPLFLTCGISCQKMNLFVHPFNLILTKRRLTNGFIHLSAHSNSNT